MKSFFVASIAFFASAALAGCGSVLSLEDKSKLVEYEKCLEFEENRIDRAIELNLAKANTYQNFLDREKFELNNLERTFDDPLESCAKYRP